MLTREKKIKRKLQEIILAQRLTDQRSEKITQENPERDSGTIRQKTKESILETYLNYVYYGNHSYGIQSAAQNYFHTTAKTLTPLQSAILASLPQSPSTHNPLTKPDAIIGYREIYPKNKTIKIYPHISSPYQKTITNNIAKEPLTIQSPKKCLQDIQKRLSRNAPYTTGRKDRVLCRMYTNGYINVNELQKALVETSHTSIYESTNKIISPHFVFWVQKFLQTSTVFSNYHIDKDILSQ